MFESAVSAQYLISFERMIILQESRGVQASDIEIAPYI